MAKITTTLIPYKIHKNSLENLKKGNRFKKGQTAWNKGNHIYLGGGPKKGEHPSIKTEFKKGQHYSVKTEFKKGKKIKPEEHPNWKGGISIKYLILKAPRKKPEQCELCGSFGRICYDHNHSTGNFRGWICHRCNVTLGFVKDNKELLLAMVKYLENN